MPLLGWLFTGLSTLFGFIFRKVLFSGVVGTFVSSLLILGAKKIFSLFALSIFTYVGSQFTIDYVVNFMKSQFNSMSLSDSNWLTVINVVFGQLQADQLLSIYLTAYAAAFYISTLKIGSRVVSSI